MRQYSKYIQGLFALGMVLLLTGWGSLERQAALPAKYANEATVDGMVGVRYATNTSVGVDALFRDFSESLKLLERDSPGTPINYLSLSGGGGNGAFGAGLLYGWTQHGDRPEFNMVTGVSTGALMAPFAYLGSAYDEQLKKLYTNLKQSDVAVTRNLTTVLWSDGLADTAPLYKLISTNITAEILRRVAYEYEVRGRWLLIGTTNLDSGQPIVWNMGKIASYGTPQALTLFRRVMLASASIPALFSPMMFDVTYQGKHYQEMHVDGSVSRLLFLYPASLFRDSGAYKLLEGRQREAYLIRNGAIDQDHSRTIPRKTLSIAKEALTQFSQSHSDGDILFAYETARRDGFGFNLAYITHDFKAPAPSELFDGSYMRELFAYAQNLARKGYPWAEDPPGLNEAKTSSVAKHRDELVDVLKKPAQAESAKEEAAEPVR